MQQLLFYLRQYYTHQFKAVYFAAIALFLSVAIWYNYKVNFENTVLDSFLFTWQHPVASFLFYALPYFTAVVLYSLFYKQYSFWLKPGFWLCTLLGLVVIALNESCYYQNLWLQKVVPAVQYYFVRRMSDNLVSELIFFVPLVIYWYFNDREQQPLYGFNSGKIQLAPYFTMMLIMLPLISWASFQDDFLRSYPSYRIDNDNSAHPMQHFLLYEITYGIDFIGVEFFFRGFLVLAVGRYLGAGSIMPMVCMYAFLHFGKPIGETIGSIFGGTILGILAYYSRSIYGGIIIHLGVAYLMDITAFLQTIWRTAAN